MSNGTRVREEIRFLLNGAEVVVADVDPTRTVLQYLREDRRLTGTKEGCAEGDCGACTVVVADLDEDGSPRARAINSCIQFLPTIAGKALYTVDGLDDDGRLHPAQQALVDCHGSQCGFCTPGFVMSLVALYKNDVTPQRRDIDDALAGNLCRCTGYAPIVEAATRMYAIGRDENDAWLRVAAGKQAADEKRLATSIAALADGASLRLEHGSRRFFAPRSVQELALLYDEYPDATLLAGGTDVGLWVTKQHRELGIVIYTGNVRELHDVEQRDGELVIGAAATLSDVLPHLVDLVPGLDEMLMRFASPPIRNAGTLGGNVANGSPIGDTMPALLALDASLELRRGSASRRVPLDEFYLGYRRNALAGGEFLAQIVIPLPAADAQFATYKISKRFDQDISAICGAFLLDLDGDRVEHVRLAYGGMAEVPKRAAHAERALRGHAWDESSLAAASAALEKDYAPITDMRASAAYRMQVAKNLLARFYRETTGQAVESVYAYGR